MGHPGGKIHPIGDKESIERYRPRVLRPHRGGRRHSAAASLLLFRFRAPVVKIRERPPRRLRDAAWLGPLVGNRCFRSADREILESGAGRLLRIEDPPAVEEQRSLHRAAQAPKIDLPELVPLGRQDQRVRPPRPRRRRSRSRHPGKAFARCASRPDRMRKRCLHLRALAQ